MLLPRSRHGGRLSQAKRAQERSGALERGVQERKITCEEWGDSSVRSNVAGNASSPALGSSKPVMRSCGVMHAVSIRKGR